MAKLETREKRHWRKWSYLEFNDTANTSDILEVIKVIVTYEADRVVYEKGGRCVMFQTKSVPGKNAIMLNVLKLFPDIIEKFS